MGEQVEAFVRGGYYFAQLSNGSFEADFDGFAVGGGMQHFFTDKDGVRVEYTYLDGDGGSADTFGIAYVRNF